MAKFKIQKAATVNQGFDAVGGIGGTGGLTSISGNQLQPQVRTGGSQTTGSILRGKGRGKFLVTDGSTSQVCTLVNKGTGLASGEMSVQIKTSSFAANVGNLGVSSATTFVSVIWSNANVAGVTRPTVGSSLTGLTGITGTATITSIASYGSSGSNANVQITSQTVSNVASITASTISYAARLSNKFVNDFNGTKYTWASSAPTSTTVQLPTA